MRDYRYIDFHDLTNDELQGAALKASDNELILQLSIRLSNSRELAEGYRVLLNRKGYEFEPENKEETEKSLTKWRKIFLKHIVLANDDPFNSPQFPL